jgi:hypothetical protein
MSECDWPSSQRELGGGAHEERGHETLVDSVRDTDMTLPGHAGESAVLELGERFGLKTI